QEKLDLAQKTPIALRSAADEEAIGDLCLALGDKEHGKEAFVRALEKDPEDPLAHSGMGKALSAFGELKAARIEMEKALAEVDNDASLFFEYGSLLRKAGETEAALTALQ